MRLVSFFQLGIVLLLCACTTTEQELVVVEEEETMTHLGPNLRPENLFFPEYLFMPDFELNQHGRIPGSSVVGAGLQTQLGLQATLQRFLDVLSTNGWTIASEAVADHSFRLQGSLKGDTLEIRAVQGSGPTQVFVLYQSKPDLSPP